jgi:hypothetical protein
MSEIVGLHGMAQQQRGRSQLLAVWEPALRDGVEIAGGKDAVMPSFGRCGGVPVMDCWSPMV